MKGIDSNDANRRYFDVLKKVVKLVGSGQAYEKINLNHEWVHFKELLAAKEQGVEVGTESYISRNNVIVPVYPQKRSAFHRTFVFVAIAASILLIGYS